MGEVAFGGAIGRCLLQDLEQRLGVSDLLSFIEDTASELAALGTSPFGHVDFTEPLLRSRGIGRIRAGEPVGNAEIRAGTKGYEITYKRHLSEPHRRFAIAHEIGHTLWFDPGGGGKPLSPYQGPIGPDRTIEELCSRFAAALLLPYDRIVGQLSCDGSLYPPLRWIPVLATRFRLPSQAAAKRVLYEYLDLRMAVLSVSPCSGGGQVQWCVLPPTAKGRERLREMRVALRGKARKIPEDMLPALGSSGVECETGLDGRLWQGLLPFPKRVASRPLSRWPRCAPRQGFVHTMPGGGWLMGLPLSTNEMG